MPLEARNIEINKFDGGFTDCPSSPANCYMKADNLFLSVTNDWNNRPGSVIYDTASEKPEATRIGKLINYNKDDTLLAVTGAKLYYYKSSDHTWNQILGPTGNSALIGATTSGRVSVVEWKKQLFITSTESILPVKVFRDGSGTWKAVTAGLPAPSVVDNFNSATVLASAITLANTLRTNIKAHVTKTSSSTHKTSDTVSNGIISSSAATDLSSLITLTTQLLLAFDNHNKDVNKLTYHYTWVDDGGYTAQLEDMVLSTVDAPTTLAECVSRLHDIKTCFNFHASSYGIHLTADGANMDLNNDYVSGVTSGPNAVLDFSFFYTKANLLKANYNLHLNDYGAVGTEAHKAATSAPLHITSSDATTPESLCTLIGEMRLKYSTDHETDAAITPTPTIHRATESSSHMLPKGYNSDLYGGVLPYRWSNIASALNELITYINSHMKDLTAHYTTNPDVQAIPYLMGSELVVLSSYNYAITYSYTYTVGSVTFLTESTPIYFQADSVIDISLQNLTVSNIPVLSNGSTTNYDTSNVVVKIYRTVAGGTTYFLSGTVSNGTTSYTDDVTDEELQSKQTLYTEGGVLENDTPPSAKFIHLVSNYAYYANFGDTPNRILQSAPNIPDSCDGTRYVDLPTEVQGISSARGVTIAWTATTTYRIEGMYDNLGQGQMSAVPISEATGLVASLSPVQVDEGVVFAGNDGFYITDGYAVKKISTLWQPTYLALVNTSAKCGVIQGAYDRTHKRIWWSVNDGGSEANSCYVLDLNHPISPNSVFTTLSGGSSFAPTALVHFNGQMIRGDSRGYVFKHDDSYTSDPKVNTGTASSTWSTLWVTYLHKSVAFDFDVINVRKWIPRMTMKAKNTGTNLSLQWISNNDDGRVVSYLTPVRFRGSSRMIEEKRHFPAGSMRCGSKQMQFTNAKVVITNSDTLGQATLNHSAKTLTLLSGSWPTDIADQLITFANDSYTTEWTVASVSGGVMTITDAGGTLPANGTYKWELKGYPKDEKIEVVSYSLNVALLGSSQSSAQGETGANA